MISFASWFFDARIVWYVGMNVDDFSLFLYTRYNIVVDSRWILSTCPRAFSFFFSDDRRRWFHVSQFPRDSITVHVAVVIVRFEPPNFRKHGWQNKKTWHFAQRTFTDKNLGASVVEVESMDCQVPTGGTIGTWCVPGECWRFSFLCGTWMALISLLKSVRYNPLQVFLGIPVCTNTE